MKSFFDVIAERAVLGSLFRAQLFAELSAEVSPDYFSEPLNLVLQAIVDVASEGGALIPHSVLNLLTERDQLARVGGAVGIHALIDEAAPGIPAARYYLDRIRDKWIHREQIRTAKELSEKIVSGEGFSAFDNAMQSVEKLRESAARIAPPRALMDIESCTLESEKTILGCRFLCVGGSMLFVGPSGIGKSSASVQQDLLWALGREAFGIRPQRPLRILCIQAENDDGDLVEMREGVCSGLRLSDEDREAVRHRVFYETDCGRTGAEFLTYVDSRLCSGKFDLLRIDPFMAYLGADVSDAESTAAFLRKGLNPILAKRAVACVLNHHTPKVTNRDTSGWRGSDWMYAGAGSADVTNWARAILVIDPTHAPHVFRFIAAKRGGRIGWVTEKGVRETMRHYCHASDGLYWRLATDEDMEALEAATAAKKARKPVKTDADLKALIPTDGASPKTELIKAARERGFSKHGAEETLKRLIKNEQAFVWRINRSGTNAEVRISLHQQGLAVVNG